MSSSKESAPKKLWLVEFKPAPANPQHMKSFIVGAEENGFVVMLVISKCLSPIADQLSKNVIHFTRSDTVWSILLDTLLFFLYRWFILYKILCKEKPETILLVNWHPINAIFCIMSKIVAGSKIIVWLHEPYKADKHVYGAKAIAFFGVEFLQSIAMPWIDDVVVHSETGLEAFKIKYPKSKQNIHVIPLQFQDRPGKVRQRTLVSFLGRAAKAKGIDTFFELIELSASKKLDWQFGIATGDDISKYLKKMSPIARSKLEIVYDPNLSDEAIREMTSNSLAIICPYISNMQSGLVPVAFMCGTPVVATNIKSLRESIRHKETGYLIHKASKTTEILEALEYIENNFHNLSQNCRQKFLATYDGRNWINTYNWLCED